MDVNKKLTIKQTLKLPNLDINFNRSLQYASKAKFYKPQVVFDRDEINCKHVAIYCCCTAWFVSDLVGNTEDSFFSRLGLYVTAQLFVYEALVMFTGAPMAEWLRPLSSNDWQSDTAHETYQAVLRRWFSWAIFLFSPHFIYDWVKKNLDVQ